MIGCTRSRRHSGFSLIELAVVLVIIGLLVGGGVTALEATRTQSMRSDQEQQLEQVRDALHGFAMQEGRLPCPDGPDDNGNEDLDTDDECRDELVSAGKAHGRVPWADLGLGRRDAWGNPLRYAVTAEYADDPGSDTQTSFTLGSEGDLDIHDDHDDSNSIIIAEAVPAVVVSFGPQGAQVWGGALPCSIASPPAGFSADEAENCDDDEVFVDTGYRNADTSRGRFDDMLMWLSNPVLKTRMIQAGNWQ